jgi:hypothetical protein
MVLTSGTGRSAELKVEFSIWVNVSLIWPWSETKGVEMRVARSLRSWSRVGRELLRFVKVLDTVSGTVILSELTGTLRVGIDTLEKPGSDWNAVFVEPMTLLRPL